MWYRGFFCIFAAVFKLSLVFYCMGNPFKIIKEKTLTVWRMANRCAARVPPVAAASEDEYNRVLFLAGVHCHPVAHGFNNVCIHKLRVKY